MKFSCFCPEVRVSIYHSSSDYKELWSLKRKFFTKENAKTKRKLKWFLLVMFRVVTASLAIYSMFWDEACLLLEICTKQQWLYTIVSQMLCIFSFACSFAIPKSNGNICMSLGPLHGEIIFYLFTKRKFRAFCIFAHRACFMSFSLLWGLPKLRMKLKKKTQIAEFKREKKMFLQIQ